MPSSYYSNGATDAISLHYVYNINNKIIQFTYNVQMRNKNIDI